MRSDLRRTGSLDSWEVLPLSPEDSSPAPDALAILDAIPTVDEAEEPHFLYNTLTRGMDIAVSLAALLVLLPVFAIVGVLNARTGPVFFRQRRLGKGGEEFVCLKFRSMVPGAEGMRDSLLDMNITNGPTFKHRQDPRVTTLGRFLRSTSMDELPQFINVLRGEMSLVGPRPLAVKENCYTGRQALRLSVKPGLTGIWQVSGRSNVDFNQWMEMDLQYVETRSVLLNLKLILLTLPAILRREGAY